MSGPLERGKDWGCGVVELVTHVHVHVQIVGPRGMGRFMQVFYFYIFLSFSFLPSCASRTTPFSQIHVQYLLYLLYLQYLTFCSCFRLAGYRYI